MFLAVCLYRNAMVRTYPSTIIFHVQNANGTISGSKVEFAPYKLSFTVGCNSARLGDPAPIGISICLVAAVVGLHTGRHHGVERPL